MPQNYLEMSYLKSSLVLGTALLLSSCSNISPLTKTTVSTNQNTHTIPSKVTPVTMAAAKPAAMSVDWQKIEKLADSYYKTHPEYAVKSQSVIDLAKDPPHIKMIEASYAKAFGLTAIEARKRLILQSSSRGVIDAVKEVLGDDLVDVYYVNNNPDEFRLGVTATHAVKASSYLYTFKESAKYLTLPIYIYPISDKTKAQIDEHLEKAIPEIWIRYPDTQSIGFSPMTNTINVTIYRKVPNETERQRIETELTELVGHPVTVEFIKDRITTL